MLSVIGSMLPSGWRIKDTEDVWTMLVSARIKDGVVVLNPIEFYDFIEDMDFHSFSPSTEITTVDPQYAHVLLKLISEVENSVVRCVRSGLSSTTENHATLIEKIKRAPFSIVVPRDVSVTYSHKAGTSGAPSRSTRRKLMP